MQKAIKKILIGLSIVIGILVLAALGFFLKFYIETKGMTPAETSRINDSVFCCKDKFVNTFVFKGKLNYLMVDAGINENAIRKELNKLGISPEQITTLLLTHTDGDHIGSIGLFRNAKVYMHKEEEQMINGKNGKFLFIRTKWKYGPYYLLNNSDTLTIDGLKVRIIHTPGHTPGSSSYLIDNVYLLTGDNVAYKNGKFEHFNSFFNMNTKEQEASIKNLPGLDTVRYVLTAHYGIIKH